MSSSRRRPARWAAGRRAAASEQRAAQRAGGGGGRAAQTPEQLKTQQDRREKLRQWRLTTPLSFFADVKKKFNSAGIQLVSYTCNGMGDDYTAAEIDKHFEQAKALGAQYISSSTQVSVAQKLIPFAEKHKFKIAFHGHAAVDNPNEFATVETYEKAFAMSKYFWANPDIGHMTAANLDPIPFIQKHHARIGFMHIKDRKKNQGQNQPFGQGDTPVKEVLEFEYRVPEGSTTVAEWKKSLEYMKAALA